MPAPSTPTSATRSSPLNEDFLRRHGTIGSGHAFPVVLHDILENAEATGLDEVISWTPTGRAFKIHDKKRFLKEIVPQHFRLTKYKSFCRQMNLWDFKLERIGAKKGECKYKSSSNVLDEIGSYDPLTQLLSLTNTLD